MPRTTKLKWRIYRPRRSAFAGVTGDKRLYRVRSLKITSTGRVRVGAAVAEVVVQALRLADKNLTKQRRHIVFAWDPVYSALTVTFSNGRRSSDGPDVLKLFCTGWDNELQKLKGRPARTRSDARGREIYDLIELCLVHAGEMIAVVSKHVGFKVKVGFTDDPEGSWVQEMR